MPLRDQLGLDARRIVYRQLQLQPVALGAEHGLHAQLELPRPLGPQREQHRHASVRRHGDLLVRAAAQPRPAHRRIDRDSAGLAGVVHDQRRHPWRRRPRSGSAASRSAAAAACARSSACRRSRTALRRRRRPPSGDTRSGCRAPGTSPSRDRRHRSRRAGSSTPWRETASGSSPARPRRHRRWRSVLRPARAGGRSVRIARRS